MNTLNIEHIRPLQSPKCDYAIVSSAGTQFTGMGNALSLLVLQAIGKYYISPTRYRQIVETESSTNLNEKEREIISQDQKHANYTAKRHYQKLNSRDVAVKGKQCMRKLVGPIAEEHTSTIVEAVKAISQPDLTTADTPSSSMQGLSTLVDDDDDTPAPEDRASCSKQGLSVSQEDTDEVAEISTTTDETDETDDHGVTAISKDVSVPAIQGVCGVQIEPIDVEETILLTNNKDTTIDSSGLEVKKEELEKDNEKKNLRFTMEEDAFIKKGYAKYAKCPTKWAKILSDSDYKFHPSRSRDSIRMRATTMGVTKAKKKKAK